MISWLAGAHARAGQHRAALPRDLPHARIAEAEAIQRVVTLAELIDVPILIVHVSTRRGIEAIRAGARARRQGLRRDLPAVPVPHREGHRQAGPRGRDVLLQPAAARRGGAGGVLAGLKDGALQVFSSDHAPYRFDESGKLPKGDKTTFKEMANGVPGLELRLPLLFSVRRTGAARITLAGVRRADRDPPRADVRPLSAQGHDRGRRRCRYRDLGSGEDG